MKSIALLLVGLVTITYAYAAEDSFDPDIEWLPQQFTVSSRIGFSSATFDLKSPNLHFAYIDRVAKWLGLEYSLCYIDGDIHAKAKISTPWTWSTLHVYANDSDEVLGQIKRQKFSFTPKFNIYRGDTLLATYKIGFWGTEGKVTTPGCSEALVTLNRSFFKGNWTVTSLDPDALKAFDVDLRLILIAIVFHLDLEWFEKYESSRTWSLSLPEDPSLCEINNSLIPDILNYDMIDAD